MGDGRWGDGGMGGWGDGGMGRWGDGGTRGQGDKITPNCTDVALLRLYTPNS